MGFLEFIVLEKIYINISFNIYLHISFSLSCYPTVKRKMVKEYHWLCFCHFLLLLSFFIVFSFKKVFFLLLFCFHKFYFYFSFLSSFPSLQLPLVVPKQVVGFQKIPPLDLQVQLLRIRDLLVPEVA